MSLERRLERNLTVRYISALVVIALLSSVATFVLYKALSTEEEAAKVSTLIPMQQNRIQKIALLSIALTEATQPHNMNLLKDNLLSTIEGLEDDHDFLLTTLSNKLNPTSWFKGEPGHDKTELVIYQSLDREIRTFVASAKYLHKHAHSLALQKKDLAVKDLLDRANSNLTAMLSKIHETYRYGHGEQILRYKELQLASLITILMVLLLEALFLFRPIVRSIRHEHQEILKAKEAADRANQVKTEFLANVSHEIRTPLTAIIGFTDMLFLIKDLPERQREFGLGIRRSAVQLKTLIDDLLDLGEAENDRIEVQMEEVPIDDLLHEVYAVFAVKRNDSKVDFKVSYACPLPRLIASDPVRIKQILNNLLSNAFKFTETGTIQLTAHYDRLNKQLTFTVADTGIGIPQGQQAKLFCRFFQADASKTRKWGGSGIGLHLTQHLCRVLGGDLILKESTVGRGSTFEARIIAGALEPEEWVTSFGEEKQAANDHEFGARDLKNRLAGVAVLLVEDGAENRRIYQYFLELAGAKVSVATDGVDGVQDALREDYDIVLMDIQMPKIDGCSATKILKAHGYEKPIIALTAHAMPSERELCMSIGFSDYVTKPVTIPKLVEIVEKFTQSTTQSTRGSISILPDETKEHAGCSPTSSFEATTSDLPIRSLYHGQELYSELLRGFGQSLAERLSELNSAFSAHNWLEVSRIAHKMNGSAATYGFPMLSEKARELEVLARKTEHEGQEDWKILSTQLSNLTTLSHRIIAGC